MAIQRIIFLSILLSFAAISVTARPCKTILFISSSSSSSFPAHGNPDLLFPNPRFVTFSYTPRLRHLRPELPFSGEGDSLNRAFTFPAISSQKTDRVDFDSSVGNSIRDRTLDILSIVSALLFGVGCGALTAAAMYLIWYICSPRSFDINGESDGEDDVSPKKLGKLGYVAVPTDTVASPAPAKQVE